MRRDIIKDVQIKEPPLEELTRKYSTFSTIKRGCCGGCGCLLFLAVILVLVAKFALGVGPQDIKKIPADFPADIPVYDKDGIESITFISGRYKNRVIELAAIFPKIILTPLISVLEEDSTAGTPTKVSSFRSMWKIINSPVSDRRDVVKIKWGSLNTDADFIYSYYKNELEKNNYTIEVQSSGTYENKFSFGKQGINGSFYVKNRPDGPSTEFANLIINYYPAGTATSTN